MTKLIDAEVAPTHSRRAVILLAAGWILALSAMVLWLRTPLRPLREQLRVAQFWSLEICFILLLAVGGVVIARMLRNLGRRHLWQMAGLALLALVVTVWLPPRTNRIYFDEQIYQSIGQNLSDLKLAQMCNDGTVEYGHLQCWAGEYNKQPYAYPHLLSVAYRIFGVSEGVAFTVNAAVMALTVCLVFLLTMTLFGDARAATFSGIIFLMIPQQLLWSATAAVEPSASMACVLALFMAGAFVREKSTVALASAGIATAWAVQFRPESFLVVPVVALILWIGLPAGEFRRPRIWAVGLLALALAAVHAGHLVAVRDEGWGTGAARLALGYVPYNLTVNGPFYVSDGRFPVVFSMLAGLGLFGPGQFKRFVMAVYFLLFFGIFLMFYAGSYNFGADVRYSLMTYPPIAVLGGLGASSGARWVGRFAPASQATTAVIALLVVQFLWYTPLVRATTEEAWAARADVEFAARTVPQLPGNAYVLTHNPGMFHIWGINAGQISSLTTNPEFMKFLSSRYGGGGIYVHWNFWCNVMDPVQRGFCEAAIAGREHTVLAEYRERDQRFGFYRYVLAPQK